MSGVQLSWVDQVTDTHSSLPNGYKAGMYRMERLKQYKLVLAGGAIAAGACVELTTSDATGVTVDEADANTDVVIGICETAIASGSYGWMTLEGHIASAIIKTGISAGDILRPSSTSGALDKVATGSGRRAVAVALEANSSGSDAVKVVYFVGGGVSGEAADAMDLSSAQTASGVKTMTGANVITHAATSGLRVFDTGGDHRISINATSDEAADRALSIPALGGNDTLMTLGTAQTVTGVKTMSGANVITHAPTGLKIQDSNASHVVTIAPGDESADRTLSIPVLGAAADIVVTVGNQTIAGTKTFSTPLLNASIGAGAKRQVLVAHVSPETGVCSDATVYRRVLAFGRAGTVTRILYGTSVDPVSGTNVIVVEKNGFSGNTMLNAASVSLNGATANVAQVATLTGTGADLTLTATDTIACEYNAGTQGTDAENVWVMVEFQPDDF